MGTVSDSQYSQYQQLLSPINMLRNIFLLSVCVWLGSHGLPRSARSDNFAWIHGPQGSGDCDRTCSDISARCSEGMGQRAAADNKILELTSWYHHGCKGYNAWDYGQGFSECTDPACCLDGSCQNHCSITSSWPGCGDIGNFNGHHSRICPCEFLEPPPPPPPGSWIEYGDRDCSNGYGGTNIIPHPVVDPQTLDNCKSACLATKDCSGVVFGKPNAPYPGCHLRKDVEAQNCRKSSNYNLYIFTDVCTEPKGVTGQCEAVIPMWTYDKFSRKCEKFIYGGCQGNGNRFQSKAECEEKCDASQGGNCGPKECNFSCPNKDQCRRTCACFVPPCCGCWSCEGKGSGGYL